MNNSANIAPILVLGMLVISWLPSVAGGCGSSKYDCGDGRCIPIQKFCDKVDDCGDNKDEEWCIRNGDSVYCDQCSFACDNRTRCLVSWFVCDGENDCQDGSDEKYCPETKEALELRCDTGAEPTSGLATLSLLPAEDRSCGSSKYDCGDGRCIPIQKFCDKVDDCGDNKDEEWCIRNGDSVYCDQCSFACDNRTRCLVSWFVCDGENDCQDGSDEKYCPETKEALELRCDTGAEPTSGLATLSLLPAEDRSCGSSKYDCGDGRCIPIQKFCDKVDDCGDNKDEEWCIRNGDSVYCDQCSFACDNRTRCLVSWFVCDGENDCQDGSDEKYCPETKEALELRCDTGAEPTSGLATLSLLPAEDRSCGSSKYDCGDGRCIPIQKFCDKVDDCGDNKDEEWCIRNGDSVYCDQCSFACDNRTRCLVSWFVCDGENDCQDGSDEKYCPETKEALELALRYRCRAHVHIGSVIGRDHHS
ncbi:hypothetical protein MTO96_034706 [Rhipicephalus appendiculatus]